MVREVLIVTVLTGVLFLAASCSRGEGEGDMKKETGRVVRKAVGAGRWYPDDKAELESMVSNFIAKASMQKIDGRIVGAIAPHAGFIYSGPVAGCTFRAIKDNAKGDNRPETVVILGFGHQETFQGVALMDGDAIETPLGEAELDKEAGEILTNSSSRIIFNYRLFGSEHSAENEIPFVQMALPETKIVVALMGDHDPAIVKELVTALNELAKKKRILVVGSTDMLHDPDYELVTKTDKVTLDRVAAMDHAGIMKSWGYSKQVFCGIGPVETVMQFSESQGCKKGTVLKYRNTGDDYPESRGNWVVGYGAVVFVGGDK